MAPVSKGERLIIVHAGGRFGFIPNALLIYRNKPTHKTYVIDTILAENNHTVLRLPPYHPDLNPIELIWGDVKQWVGSKNVSFKIKDVEMLCRERFKEIGKKEWENVCNKVEENEHEYWEKDGIMEERIEKIIIEDNGMESSDEESEHETDQTEYGDNMSGVEELDEY
ncbi:hypothetical protein L9F63_012808 [Diploptera punctata]|uniref:Tc1-like transposase DDE domain-containing protein n=2 Tax=Diploptera punctata TaxID=6984 RepID=A0AAD8ABK0_DIPPU|nr:hypothetical protein L9F63_012808 [Diploptera punctata]